MIFNNGSDIYSMNGITESPYPLGLEGALMHVYENECNYNAIMKSVGISELRYYQETGKDLFVHEAGAFAGFIAKAKVFFKKVIEKIKSIFKKFMAKINQYRMSNKDFVKKYQNDILRRDLTDFEYDGYTFKDLLKYIDDLCDTGSKWIGKKDDAKSFKDSGTYQSSTYKDSDAVNDMKEEGYAVIAMSTSDSLTESEMRDEIKEKCYGDKESFKVDIRLQLKIISEADKYIKETKKAQDKIIKAIEDYIKVLESLPAKINTANKATPETPQNDIDNTNNMIKRVNQDIEINKAMSNALTVAFGIAIGACNDCVKQAKAICVKALSYKHESVTYGGYNSSDIFADVVIR